MNRYKRARQKNNLVATRKRRRRECRLSLKLVLCKIIPQQQQFQQQLKIANNHDEDEEKRRKTLQLDQLRAIVVEQGRAMSKMLEEQTRLNKWLEEALSSVGERVH